MDARELLDTFEQDFNRDPKTRCLPPPMDGREFYLPRLFAVARAVLDLHPRREYIPGRPRCGCVDCRDVHGDPIAWPCSTVRAITVVLNPEFELVPADLRVEVFRNTGASTVKVTHLPTGLGAQCGSEKTEAENKAEALKILRKLLEATPSRG